MRLPALLVALAVCLGTGSASAPASAASRDVFEGTVTSVGPPPKFLCGVVMATQEVTLRVTRVHAGTVRVGTDIAVRVMTCGGGKHFVPQPVGFQLDPKQVHVGRSLRIDAETNGTSWLVLDSGIQP